MIAKLDAKTLVISVISLLFPILIFSQESSEDSNSREELIQKAKFYELRGANAIDAAIGTSVINGDFVDPEFEIYSHIGFKRHITPYFAIDLGYHKFNLAYIDIYNEGFMSFDLNLDVTVFPYKRFSPFIFAGGGLNASNHFQQTAGKLQGGGGVEYIFTDTVGIKLYTDYNLVFSDELYGLEAGGSDDTYFRIAVGVNFYFGGYKQKHEILKGVPTEINSNLLNE